MVCGMCFKAHAVTPKALADSLNVFAAGYASVDPVAVKVIRQKGRNIAVYTNHSLGCLSLSEEDLKVLRSKVSLWVRGDNNGIVSIYSDKRELDELVTSRFRPRPAKDRFRHAKGTRLTENLSRPYSAPKGLDDRHIALWASHGLYFNQDEQRWRWQRARLWTTVEDLFTSSFTMPFLVPMLENAGAVVIQPRERDTQTEEIIGKTTGGRFCPAVQKEGNYAVYVRYEARPDNTRSAEYEVVHKGQTTLFRVNQHAGGGMWVYLGTFAFGTDTTGNYICLRPEGADGRLSRESGIKLGGGMGSIARYAQGTDSTLAVTSGYPRFMEGARYWLEYNGFSDSIYSHTEGKNDYTDDLACRGRWVNCLAGGSEVLPGCNGLQIPIDMSIALHSDAGASMDETKIGTLAIYTDRDNDKQTHFPAGGSRMTNRDLADKIQTQLTEDLRRTHCPDWPRRGLKNASYSESRMPKVPCALIEMLSHQNLADMKLGLDPAFKFTAARAIYKGILRFLHEQNGTPFVVQPLPVRAFAIEKAGDSNIRLTWKETADTMEQTAQAAYYILYTREEGKDWDNGVRIKTTGSQRDGETTMRLKPNRRYDFRVCAGNDGGISLPSETLSACLIPGSKHTALIINSFTRVAAPDMSSVDSLTGGIVPGSYAIPYGTDVSYIGEQYDFNRAHQWLNDDECGFGMCHADKAHELTAGNTFDYPAMHGNTLQQAGISYVSRSAESISSIEGCDIALLIMGKQRSTDSAPYWPDNLRNALTEHLNSGGRLLMSGSYPASGLKSKEEKKFAEQTLHYRFHSTHASHNGHVSFMPPMQVWPLIPTCTFAVTPNPQTIVCEAPDGIEPTAGAVRIARYEDSGVCAGVAYNKQILVLPFMLESVTAPASLLQTCLNYLLSD